MQTARRLLCLGALLVPGEGHFAALQVIRRHQALQAAQATAAVSSGQLAAAAKADAEDRSFWASQWNGIEEELLQLRELSGPEPQHQSQVSLVQSGNGSSSQSPAPRKVNARSSSSARHKSPLAGIKINLNPKSAADLAPALAMLKGLYESGKERIAELNAREKKNKAQFEEKQKAHDARIAEIDADFKKHSLSDEFHANETRDENRLFSYWQRVRERQHRQFHTSLKIQHGTLSKVKSMIDVYEKTMAGKADKAEVKKDLAKVGVAPEVVLLQEAWHEAAPFFDAALQEARQASTELQDVAPKKP